MPEHGANIPAGIGVFLCATQRWSGSEAGMSRLSSRQERDASRAAGRPASLRPLRPRRRGRPAC